MTGVKEIAFMIYKKTIAESLALKVHSFKLAYRNNKVILVHLVIENITLFNPPENNVM